MRKVLLAAFFAHAMMFYCRASSDSTEVSIWKKPKFFLQLDKYNSFVSDQGANVGGIKTGLEFGRKYRFGIGLYNLKSDIIEYKEVPSQDAEGTIDTVKAQLNMGYVPLCFEYIFYDKGKWQFGLPVHLGVGETYFNYFDKDGQTKKIKDHAVLLTDVVVSGQYKILRWFGVGAGVGFRKMLIENPSVNREFTSPLYNLRLKIFLGEIYRTVFPRGISGKKPPVQETGESSKPSDP